MVYDGIIQGMTVLLRSAEEKDAEVTYKMRTDPEKTRFIHQLSGTVEDQRAFLRMQREKPGDYLFIVEDLYGKPIGMKGVYNFNPELKTVETGRFVGYGSPIQNMEALMLGFDFAFDVLDVKLVHMEALEYNEGMINIQKQFGAKQVSRKRVESFNMDAICSELMKEDYYLKRAYIVGLIKRFSKR